MPLWVLVPPSGCIEVGMGRSDDAREGTYSRTGGVRQVARLLSRRRSGAVGRFGPLRYREVCFATFAQTLRATIASFKVMDGRASVASTTQYS